MGEGGVIQADRDAAADYFELIGETNRAIVTRRGQYDLSACVQSHARHRQAAEKATRERDAGIAVGMKVEFADADNAGNDEAEEAWHGGMAHAADRIATAIMSQGHE